MAVAIPTLSELYASVLADLKQELGITNSIFGKAFLVPLAATQAAKLKLYYLFLAKVQKNIFIDTADPESMGGTLERFGRVKLGRGPFPATSGVYELAVSGSTSAVINASTTFKSNTGFLYILDDPYTLTGSNDVIEVRALTGGTAALLQVGDILTATAPILNVDRQAEVDSVTTSPTDAESIEDYRAKGIEAYQLEPQGGAASDYRIWSSDASGVKTSYPYASGSTANSINLYVEGNSGDGTVSQTVLDEVSAVIEQDPDTSKPLSERGRRPLGVLEVNALSVVPVELAITITGLATDTTAIRAAISSAVTEYLTTVRPFVAGADVLADRNDTLTSSKLALAVQAAIGSGNYFNALTFTANTVSLNTYNFDQGRIPKLTTITYN